MLLRARGRERELFGGELVTTNNRMEMMAAIEGLQALKRPCAVAVYTDSEYLRRGIREWMPKWKASGWRTYARKPVKNEDLWRRLDEATARHQVEWHWVKGHSGHLENDRVDRLASDAADQIAGRS